MNKARFLKAFWVGITLLGLGATPIMAADDKVVHIYNWSDYIDESVLKDFEKETGIKVVYDVFDSNEMLESKLMAGKSGFDIVVPTDKFLARQIKAERFQKLDKAKLPNLKNLDQNILKETQKFDPGNEYSIPYTMLTTGIGYNTAKIKERMPNAPVDSWKMIFDPTVVSKFADCGVYVLDTPAELVPAALNYMGEDPNTKDQDVITKAEELLKSVRPYIRKFHNSQYINDLANGDVCLVVGYSGDIFQAQTRAQEAKNGVDIQYVIPKEGAMLAFDLMAIPSDAPHAENAHKFLDYILRPEIMAKITNKISYANVNEASSKFVNAEIKNNPGIYPPEDVMKKLYYVTPYDLKTQRFVTRMWTNIKNIKSDGK